MAVGKNRAEVTEGIWEGDEGKQTVDAFRRLQARRPTLPGQRSPPLAPDGTIQGPQLERLFISTV